MKSVKGITLIALVITVVILIILAGVAVNLAIGENGIFNKAKFATKEYLNADTYEQEQIGKISNEIDGYVGNSRGTVTLTEEQFNCLFSAQSNKLINMPNTWEVGTEYTWGTGTDKIYGQRFSGSITENANQTIMINLCSTTEPLLIINQGGWYAYNVGSVGKVALDYSGNNFQGSCYYNEDDDTLKFVSKVPAGRNNANYDIWVLYTKTIN